MLSGPIALEFFYFLIASDDFLSWAVDDQMINVYPNLGYGITELFINVRLGMHCKAEKKESI